MGTCWLLSADWAVLPQLSMSVCVDQWINIGCGQVWTRVWIVILGKGTGMDLNPLILILSPFVGFHELAIVYWLPATRRSESLLPYLCLLAPIG